MLIYNVQVRHIYFPENYKLATPPHKKKKKMSSVLKPYEVTMLIQLILKSPTEWDDLLVLRLFISEVFR